MKQPITIQYLGHACFQIGCDGYSLVLDPFAPGSVLGFRDIQTKSACRIMRFSFRIFCKVYLTNFAKRAMLILQS